MLSLGRLNEWQTVHGYGLKMSNRGICISTDVQNGKSNVIGLSIIAMES